jgi:type III pantothenate kinase
MKLLIDAGNTRVKWAWLDHGELAGPGAEPHAGGDFRPVLGQIAAANQRPSQVLVASVLEPSLTQAFSAGLAETLGAPVRLAVTEAEAAGVRNGYLDHRQLGVDRWLAVLAAYAAFRTALCVVDAGTAITIDVVAADGSHHGGLIVPGPGMMRQALRRETAGIGSASALLADIGPKVGEWGRDTDACIRRGSLRAAACLVEDCVKAWRRVEGSGAVLVLTGGDAPVLRGAVMIAAEYRPLLVLEGLALRYGSE